MWQEVDLKSISKPALQAFNIHLDHGSSLAINEIVRVIPGRRLVCRGYWGAHAVYAKIFLGGLARKYALRDKAGVEALLANNLLTPALLHEAELNDGTSILIFSAIESAESVEQVWSQLDGASRFNLAQKLVETVAQHHIAGLLQTDLYFKNFLVQREPSALDGQVGLIFTLDGDGIRALSPLFQKQKKLRNLATLFSKMDALDDKLIPELYQKYCSLLRVPYTRQDEARVRRQTQEIRYQVAAGYAEKKVFRNCTDVKVVGNFKYFLSTASGFEALTPGSLDQFLSDEQRNIKNGNTCTIAKATLASRSVIIKRYNIKNFWHGLNRAFRQSRAAISWANAHRLMISNVATPKPLALVEERFGWLRRRAYFLSEYVEAPDAVQFFRQCTSAEDKETAARNLAALFHKLYLLRLSHGDCKATNIKIVDLAPVVLDLDSMQAYRPCWLTGWWFERKHIKDLKRLMKNWEQEAEAAGLLKRALQSEYAAEGTNAGDNILIRAGIV